MMEPTRAETGNPSFQDCLRYGYGAHGWETGAHADDEQGRPAEFQQPPYLPDHDASAAADYTKSHFDNGMGVIPSKKHIHQTHQLVGQALEDRRSLARERIRRGGWKEGIAAMANTYIQKISWKDLPSRLWCVRNFLNTVDALGPSCDDPHAIRRFLDENIHRLITFQAMEKDFRVPDCIIARANQMTIDGDYKYPWFRSVLAEYRGLNEFPASRWLIPYRANGEQATTTGPDSGPHQINQVTEKGPLEQGVNEPARGRKRVDESLEELYFGTSSKKTKWESSETAPMEAPGKDLFVEGPGSSADRTVASGDSGGYIDGGYKKQVGRRTLTVLFHGMGMGSHGAKESEHIQVYVPRTATGVTINFL